MCVALTTLGNHQFSRLGPPGGGSEEWPPVRQRLTMVGRLCLQVSFHAGWTIHGGMPNVGDSTREALAISWVPEQTTMLPAFDVVGKYSSDDKLTINKLLKLKPGMAVTDDILPVRAADSLG